VSERDVRVILASAGSGKTWELATQFLRVLAGGVAPERILATTFTRKAAGEILERIFARLAEAAADEKKCAELDRALGGARRSRREYTALLARAARSIQRFRVQTLDSFFVALAQGFTSELALSPGWSIADEWLAERARSQALARVLDAGDQLEWLVLLRELERADSGRKVHDTLTHAIAVGQAIARESSAASWDCIRPRAPLDEREVERAVAAARDAPRPFGKNGKVDARWLAALEDLPRAVADGDWMRLGSKGFGKCVVNGQGSYYSKPIPAELLEAVTSLLQHAAAFVAQDLAAQNRATRRLLDDFEREYGSTQRRLGLVRFDDLPHALARGENGVARREHLDDIAYRLDGRIDHLLLDEFQDTSPAQWRVLQPWVDELAQGGPGRSLLCVGDSKQSIYGWRAADPRLLEGLADKLGVDAESLSESRRSAQVVLDAVNAVFGDLANNAVFPLAGGGDESDDKRSAAHSAATSFAHGYMAHEAHDVHKLGEVHVHTSAPADNAADSVRRAVDSALGIVEQIRARAPNATIAVLLRRNRFLPALVYGLRRRGIAASNDGGNQLTDSAAVQAVLSLLQWIDHPGDSAARFHVATSDLGPALGVSAATPAAWTCEARRQILDMGLAEWLERLRPTIASAWSDWDARRFAGLVDLAIAQRVDATPRLDEFIGRAREQRVEDASSGQVRVMTIHAAKGLEFDAVVAIELDRLLLNRPPTYLWSREDDDDPWRDIQAVSRHASETARRLLAFAGEPTVDALLFAANKRAMRDELSGLYVAMTRARHRLDLVIAPEGAENPPLTLASIVRGAFSLGHGALEPSSVVWSSKRNDAAWTRHERFHATAAAARPSVAQRGPLVFANARRSVEPERRSPSKLGVARRTATSELFESPAAGARRRGSRWHAWFERIEWLEAFRDGDAELLAHASARGLGGEGLDDDLREFRAALRRPVLGALLSRASHGDADVVVWRERRFAQLLDLEQDPRQLQTGAFDRVVAVRERGVVVRAEVLDFKTDRVEGEPQLAARTEHHAPQMHAYRAAVARCFDLDPAQVAARLVFVAADSVREL
jgi:ATP-dependent exoDNAse (exonuclease V) beta subunit